jgi:hypothetical protein
MNREPLFVIGCPRSGTTFLSELLAPTRWGAPVETHFITKIHKRLSQYGDLERRENFRRLLKDILSERAIMQWKLDIDPEGFFAELPRKDYPAIVDALCMKRFALFGKSSWGDKTPHFILDLDRIVQMFPDSKYLYIVRDGRDVALSLLRKPWGPVNVVSCADYWRRCNQETDALSNLRRNGQLLEIRYEKLLDFPEATVGQIYQFLGESLHKDVMNQLTQKVQAGNYDKWKTRMSLSQRRRFEAVAGNALKRLGYVTEFEEARLSPFERIFWKFHDRVIQFGHLVKLNTVDAIRIRFFGMEPFAD